MSVPEAAGEATEQTTAASRILEAADRLFSERGFSAVSVRDVAEAAGVTKALVFYHFASKEALFEQVLQRYYRAHAEALAKGLRGDGELGDRLHHLLDAYLDFMEENTRYAQLVIGEIARGADTLGTIRQGLHGLYEQVAEILEGHAPASGPLSIRQFFVSFSGLVNTYYLYAPVLGDMWGEEPLSIASRRQRREHLHWLVERILEGLAAAPSAPAGPSER